MDKKSCENLLKGILKEKQEDDNKKKMVQMNRLAERTKVMERHNGRIQMASKFFRNVKSPFNDQAKSIYIDTGNNFPNSSIHEYSEMAEHSGSFNPSKDPSPLPQNFSFAGGPKTLPNKSVQQNTTQFDQSL